MGLTPPHFPTPLRLPRWAFSSSRPTTSTRPETPCTCIGRSSGGTNAPPERCPAPRSPVIHPPHRDDLEREFHPQPRLRRRLVAQHLQVRRVGTRGIAARVFVSVMQLVQPNGAARAADVQPIERCPSA